MRWPLQNVEFLSIDGCPDLAVFRKPGWKRPILFTPGGAWSGARWAPFFTYLSWRYPELTEHEWITWDPPGRGWSSPPAKRDSTWLTAQDLATISHTIMTKLYANRPYVRVGHSNGCVVDLAALARGWGQAFVLIDPAPIDMTLEESDSTLGALRQHDYGGNGDVRHESEAALVDAFTSGQRIREARYPRAPGVLIRADFTHPDLRQHRDFLLRQKTEIANALLMNLVNIPSSHWVQFPAGVQPGTHFGKPDVVGYSLAAIMRHVELADDSAGSTPCLLDPAELSARGAELANLDSLLERLCDGSGTLKFPLGTAGLAHLERSPSVEREWRLLFNADLFPSASEVSSPERFASFVANNPAGGAQLIANWLHDGDVGATALSQAAASLRLMAWELSGRRNDPPPESRNPDQQTSKRTDKEGRAARFIRQVPFEHLAILGNELEKRRTYSMPTDATLDQVRSALKHHEDVAEILTTAAAELLLAEPVNPHDNPVIFELRDRCRATEYEWATYDSVLDILSKTEELKFHGQLRQRHGSDLVIPRATDVITPPSRTPRLPLHTPSGGFLRPDRHTRRVLFLR